MTVTPKVLPEAPDEADVLTDILGVVRLRGDLFLRSEFREPWTVVTPTKRELIEVLEPRAHTFVLFHMVVEGTCEVELDDGEVVVLEAGELIVFPECDVHRVRGGVGVPTPIVKLLSRRTVDGLFRINHGGTGARTRLVCGYLACDDPFVPLTTVLPSAICLRPADDGVSLTAPGSASEAHLPPHAARWLSSTLEYAMAQATDAAPGGRALLTRLSEAILVEILRQFLRNAQTGPGLLAAVADPQVGRALRILHGSPSRNWDVSALARTVGMSRSVFAERFTTLVGEAPMHYLRRWRMQLARALLRDESRSIAEVATAVGYQSESAFSRAFRRVVGEAPAAFRSRK